MFDNFISSIFFRLYFSSHLKALTMNSYVFINVQNMCTGRTIHETPDVNVTVRVTGSCSLAPQQLYMTQQDVWLTITVVSQPVVGNIFDELY